MKTGAEGEEPCLDVLEINRPDDLADFVNLGLTLAEAKRLLARVQQEIVAAQAREHAVQRLDCLRRGLPGFVVPHAAGPRRALAGHRIAD